MRVLRRLTKRVGLGRLLALVLLAGLTALSIWDPAPVEAVRLRTFDFYQRTKPRDAQVRPVVILDIDERSLKGLGQWPWPRTQVADLLGRLASLGAVAVGFDVIFAEPDRLSPARVAAGLRNLDEETRQRLSALPGNDEVLAKMIGRMRIVLGQSGDRGEGEPVTEPMPQTGFGMLGPDPKPFMVRFPVLRRNIPVLENAAAGRGLFSILPEPDGIVRRVPMVMLAEGAVVPSLTLEMLRVVTGAGAILIRSTPGGIGAVALPGFELPTDPAGRIWVHFAHHDQARYVSAIDLLEGRVPREKIAGKLVLVGTSALGLLDTKTTPVDRTLPGVEVHAQILESALTRTTLTAPVWTSLAELAAMLVIGLALIWFAPKVRATTLFLAGGVVAAALVYASWYAFSRHGLLIDATFPLGGSFAVYLTLLSTNYLQVQADRQRIRGAFGQYLSPALVEQLAQSPEKLVLGGEEKLMTIMFSDVRGFTGISERYKHDPQGLTALMNRFLTPLTNAILDNKGTVDKYMGDAIMAFWNAPLDDPDQHANACRAALGMLAAIDGLNDIRRGEAEAAGDSFLPIDLGIGFNTGTCVVGNMGSDLRFDYSVLGDTVNLASRLEGQSKTYGVRIVLGASTAAVVADSFAVVEIDLVTVKGKTQPEQVYALLGDAAARSTPEFATLHEAQSRLLAAFRGQDWDGAEAALAACRDTTGPWRIAGLWELYASRIAGYRVDPPPPGWDGVVALTSK